MGPRIDLLCHLQLENVWDTRPHWTLTSDFLMNVLFAPRWVIGYEFMFVFVSLSFSGSQEW